MVIYSTLVLNKVVTTKIKITERGGSVVTHETLIREVPGSNPDADQPDWGFFVVFLSYQGKCWVGFSLPRSIWPLLIKFIYHKIKISELYKWNIDNTTIEIHSLLIHTQSMGGSPDDASENCGLREEKEGLENELWLRWSNGRVGEWAVT